MNVDVLVCVFICVIECVCVCVHVFVCVRVLGKHGAATRTGNP